MTPLLGLLAPPACMGCRGVLTDPERWLCFRCRAGLRSLPHPRCPRCDASLSTRSHGLPCLECEQWPAAIERARAAVLLDGPAVTLVHGLKYEGWYRAAEAMAETMSPLIESSSDALLVPVPTTSYRKRIRGYNQAEVLANKLSRKSGLEVLDGLERLRGSRSQTRLGRGGRSTNVAGAFRVKARARPALRGRPVIVVDDVLTTGATVTAVADRLATVGVGGLSVLAFARAAPMAAR